MERQIAIELTMLALAGVIGLVNLLWQAAAAEGQRKDLKWNVGPRDEPRTVTGVPARLARSLANFMETFPLFAAAVIGAYLAGKLGTLTAWGAMAYVAGRALYVPLYAFGVPVARSVAWLVALVGLVMVMAAFFLA
jgi:uncharacterized MAPEG superfamily protein